MSDHCAIMQLSVNLHQGGSLITHQTPNWCICKVCVKTCPSQRRDIDQRKWPGQLLHYLLGQFITDICYPKLQWLWHQILCDEGERRTDDTRQGILTSMLGKKGPFTFVYVHLKIILYFIPPEMGSWEFFSCLCIHNPSPSCTLIVQHRLLLIHLIIHLHLLAFSCQYQYQGERVYNWLHCWNEDNTQNVLTCFCKIFSWGRLTSIPYLLLVMICSTTLYN